MAMSATPTSLVQISSNKICSGRYKVPFYPTKSLDQQC